MADSVATTTRVDVTRYGPGEAVDHPEPGDFILTHGNALFDKLIRFGQRLRFRGPHRKYAWWNHASLIVDRDGGIIEANGPGVCRENISKYLPTEYHLVHIHAIEEDRQHAVEFAEWCAQHKIKYGKLIIASVAVSLVTGTRIAIAVDGEEICSGLVARALERTGEIFENEPFHIMPGDLAEHYQIEPPAKGTPIGKAPK